MLLRLIDERGLAYTSKYCTFLHAKLLRMVRRGDSFRVASFLAEPDLRLMQDIELDKPRQGSAQAPARAPNTSKGAAVPARQGQVPSAAPARRATPQAPATGRQPTGGQKRLPVCFEHDPSRGRTCSDTSCRATKEHLDTTRRAEADRFKRASEAAERVRKARQGHATS